MKRRQTAAADAASAAPGSAATAPATGSRPAPLGRTGWLVLAAVVLVVNLPVLHLRGRRPPTASGRGPF
ncbi:MAG TPA: hypothetical protein VLQ79_07835, partial [Myxococcaceae bacterium]|nr:hypothetical protein [Myxococcaceae bacterium]